MLEALNKNTSYNASATIHTHVKTKYEKECDKMDTTKRNFLLAFIMIVVVGVLLMGIIGDSRFNATNDTVSEIHNT